MERSCFDLGDRIAVAETDLDFPCPPRAASMGLVALLVAALLTLGTHDASAQAYGHGDCLPPANSFYGIGDPQWTCGGLNLLSHYWFSGLQLEYTHCGAPPPNSPGSAVAIPLDGAMVFGFDSFCTGDPADCDPYSHCGDPSGYSVPVNTTLHVSFNHEAGSTRFFDITTDSFYFGFECDVVTVGPGSGDMTVEYLGGGIFRFNSTINVVLTDGGCGYMVPAGLFLTSPALVDAPPRGAAISLTLSPAVPNPVRSRAIIEFTLPSEGPVNLTVYDVSGHQVVSVLGAEAMPAGPHQVSLSTRDLPSGRYFYRLLTHDGSRTQSILVLR